MRGRCSGQQSKLSQLNSLLLTRAEKRWGCAEWSNFLLEWCFGGCVEVNGSKWPFPHHTAVSHFIVYIVQWHHRTSGRKRDITDFTTRCCQSTLNRKLPWLLLCFCPRVSCYHHVFWKADSQSTDRSPFPIPIHKYSRHQKQERHTASAAPEAQRVWLYLSMVQVKVIKQCRPLILQ